MNYFNVGKIVNTQGLQGEMRVLSVTDFADERFKKGAELALFDEKGSVLSKRWPLPVTASTRTSISSSLRICTISMPSRNSKDLASGCRRRLDRFGGWRVYYHEIIGLDVYENDQLIGQIKANPATRCQWCLGRETKRQTRSSLALYPTSRLKYRYPWKSCGCRHLRRVRRWRLIF